MGTFSKDNREDHHRSPLDGAGVDTDEILAYLVYNMSRSQFYLRFGHLA